MGDLHRLVSGLGCGSSYVEPTTSWGSAAQGGQRVTAVDTFRTYESPDGGSVGLRHDGAG
ncbi:hypothetical protein [Streptomyces sp. NPDC001348]